MNPKVSVVIPHKNRFDLLKITLDSILYQTLENWEAIIIDDYSHKDCLEKIKTFLLTDERIILITKNNEAKGAPISRNIGLKKAKAKYVLFLDSDDILAPYALFQRLNAFENAEKSIQAVVSPTILFKKIPGDLLEVWNALDKNQNVITRFTKLDTPWHTMGTLWEKKFLVKINGWDESLASFQDWELHLRALINGMEFQELEHYDNFYRIDSDSQSIASRFYKEQVVNGRFKAFTKIMKLIKSTENKIWINNVNSLIITNLTLLIDNNKIDIVSKLLKSYKDLNLRFIDYCILQMMKKDANSWRYRRITMVLIQTFWKKLDYDPWIHSGKSQKTINSNEKALAYNYEKLLLN